jgi:hypothetical protein
MSKELKLTIELVPGSAWYSNLRRRLPRTEWDRVRKQTYAASGYKCGVCGAEGKLNCHEIWEYDDQAHTQKLAGFIALCDLCHHVKHLGLAGILAQQGQLDYERVVKHFMAVNGCDRKMFEEVKSQAFRQWQERSRYQWTLDLGEYERFIAH